jgi:hypothetical protein
VGPLMTEPGGVPVLPSINPRIQIGISNAAFYVSELRSAAGRSGAEAASDRRTPTHLVIALSLGAPLVAAPTMIAFSLRPRRKRIRVRVMATEDRLIDTAARCQNKGAAFPGGGRAGL